MGVMAKRMTRIMFFLFCSTLLGLSSVDRANSNECEAPCSCCPESDFEDDLCFDALTGMMPFALIDAFPCAPAPLFGVPIVLGCSYQSGHSTAACCTLPLRAPPAIG